LKRSRFSTSRRGFHFPWLITVAIVATILSVLRALHVDEFVGGYTACRGCFFVPTFGNDARLLAGIFLLLAFASIARTRWLRILFGAPAAIVVFAMAIDVMLGNVVNQRLYFADLFRFAGELSGDWSVARAEFLSARGIGYATLLVVVLAALIGVVFGRVRSTRATPILFIGAGAAAAFAIYAAIASPLLYIHGQFAWNLIEANLPAGRAKPFSDVYTARQLQLSRAVPSTCSAANPSGKSIVLVITESLSAYQSALLGGPHDWLPRLDALSQTNHYFTHFYANGFTTDGGEISMLTGRLPITPPGMPWYTFSGFEPNDDTLPAIAHRAGSEIDYFTTTELSFLNSDQWLRALGFDAIEGSENSFYAGMTRRMFGAADDEALFGRFEKWLNDRGDAKPFVAVLLTVSSHPPFVDPHTGKNDAEGAFRYVDGQLADFHDALEKRGFLSNGVLMITGDHRSMTPILKDEYAKFGDRAFARIPMIVSGAVDMPNRIDAAFQQSDVPASIAQLLGVESCRNAFVGTFLEPKPAPAKYVLHTRGDDRDRVDVYFADHVASYYEDGDASSWTSETKPPDAATVAAWIDMQRIRNLPGKEGFSKPVR
jgi:lipoteichoic acid synthase